MNKWKRGSGGDGLAAVVAISGVLCLAGWIGSKGEERSWERRLVDEPEAIAAIRSRVLAERAEEEAGK